MPPSFTRAPLRHGQRHIDLDGNALRLSFDNFYDRKARAYFSAFASDACLVLAHLECDEKSNEIPAVQALLRQLGLEQLCLLSMPCTVKKNL